MAGAHALVQGFGLQGGACNQGYSRRRLDVRTRGPGPRPASAGTAAAFRRHCPRPGRSAQQDVAAAAKGGGDGLINSAGTAAAVGTTAGVSVSGRGDEAGRYADSGAGPSGGREVRGSVEGVTGTDSAGAASPSGTGISPSGTPTGAARDLSLEPFRSLVGDRRFHCTMCGKCCTGDGEIWISPDEARRIAKHLNMSVQRFLDTHTKQYSKYRGWRMLKMREGTSSCIFLGADNKCSIHTVRPSQCSTYPWWPELMVDREWEWEKANVCEGFDHPEAGPLDVEDAARQLREANKMTQLRLLASTVRMTSKVSEWADAVLVWDSELEEEQQLSLRGEQKGAQGVAKPPRKGSKGQGKGGSSGSGGR